ncbi:MAG: hypothetical protein GX573_20865 [Chloroflexi bacterium]|nr:hypothetical protein [Chloroflexota bacterium]
MNKQTTFVAVAAKRDIHALQEEGPIPAGTLGRIRGCFGPAMLRVEFDGRGDVFVAQKDIDLVERFVLTIDGLANDDSLVEIVLAQQEEIARLQQGLDAERAHRESLQRDYDELVAASYRPAPVRIHAELLPPGVTPDDIIDAIEVTSH